MKKVCIELPEEWAHLLSVLGKPEDVLLQLADHAQQAVFRPGSWERDWLAQAFGDDWVEDMETDPEAPHFQRPKGGGP